MILLTAATEGGLAVEEHAIVVVDDVAVAVVEPASQVMEVSVERDLV